MSSSDKFYLVREDVLPDAVLKTYEAKMLLASGDMSTIHDAVKKVGISRSAYYKYKDGIFAYEQLQREKMVTLSMNLWHQSGVLSHVLVKVAEMEGNVLAIHQSIPLQGIANVVLTVDSSKPLESWHEWIQSLKQMEGVHKVEVVGQG
nr:ACT domain-containing protein [Longirhabdus pacifica]